MNGLLRSAALSAVSGFVSSLTLFVYYLFNEIGLEPAGARVRLGLPVAPLESALSAQIIACVFIKTTTAAARNGSSRDRFASANSYEYGSGFGCDEENDKH
jgi:hypothetical protein